MWGEAPESVALGMGSRNWVGGRENGVGAEVLFSRRWECLTIVNLTPLIKKGGILGNRFWPIKGVSYQECLTESVTPRVWVPFWM